MNHLINLIRELTHDGFVIEFRDDGYNANTVKISKEINGNLETRSVSLPENHLEESVISYLKLMSQDAIFKKG